MDYMFNGASAFNQDLGSWNVSLVSDMTGMFANATSFSKENYDALLSGWSSRPVQPNISFRAPPTMYCDISARNILTNAPNNWTISGDLGQGCLLLLDIKLFLYGPYSNSDNMMQASLGATHLPSGTPHSDGASASSSVFSASGNDAIVDWVFIELRDKNDITTVLYSASGLLQRDGDVVGMDGVSPLSISANADEYYISVSHRNHLPIATDMTFSLSSTVTVVDMTLLSNIRGGAVGTIGIHEGKRAMFGGDFNGDGQIDVNDLIAGLAQGSLGESGYRTTDVNLDGQVQTLELTTIVLAGIGKGKQF